MPTMSKIYGVKSNAARAAAVYKLTRTDLVAVSGGWCFPIPELNPEMAADLAADAAGDEPTCPHAQPLHQDCFKCDENEPDVPDARPFVDAPADSDTTAPNPNAASTSDENEPDVPDARAAHTVVNGRPNGEPYVDPIGGADWVETIEADKTCADISSYASERVFNGTRKPKHLPKTAKAPKRVKTKTPRPVVEGTTKRGTKAYTDKMAARRRAGMNKRGITKMVIKKITGRWTPTSELLKMTGWQPTTLRGALSGYHRDHGIEIKGETRDGERYYLVAR